MVADELNNHVGPWHVCPKRSMDAGGIVIAAAIGCENTDDFF
jgi:hypothetical protein